MTSTTVGRELAALLSGVLVVAVGSLDLPMCILDGTERIGGVEHLRSTVDRGFDSSCAASDAGWWP